MGVVDIAKDIDEMAEIRADLILLKKQLGRQERTIFPVVAKWFYAVCVLLMLTYIALEVRNGQRIQHIDENLSAFFENYQLIEE